MADIYHTFPVNAPARKVFESIITSAGLDSWWSKDSHCRPEPGGMYELFFGTGYNWKAVVTKYVSNKEFELTFTEADIDWTGTRVGFLLEDQNNVTQIGFYHSDWPDVNEHYKVSCFCWAMYLRLLKRYVELGEEVPYEKRLDV